MTASNFEEHLAQYSSPVQMLRNAPFGAFQFPMRPEFSNWRDEQYAWAHTAVVFHQGHHMTDVNFRGPDVHRLLSAVAINSFKGFGKGKAKQLVGVTPEGYVIGDNILFGLDDDEVSIIGAWTLSRWVEYQAETGGYDVEVRRDDPTPFNKQGRRLFRYQIQGPNSMEIAARASNGTLPEIKTFHIGDFTIAGKPVRALNHSMTRKSGLEIWGPIADGTAVLEAILAAGADLGLVEAGGVAYSTTALESGWLGASHVPAIYSGESMRPYREWLPAQTLEAFVSLGGSFVSGNIEDYYVTPWDMGYGRIIKFDHDFIGREALERMADQPHRTKVWLRWNDDDVTRVMASGVFDDEKHRAKFLTAPNSTYATFPADAVHIGDELVGISTRNGYTVNVGGWSSLAMVEEKYAVDGTEVVLTWGEKNGGTAKPTVERHVQTKIRAVVSTTALA